MGNRASFMVLAYVFILAIAFVEGQESPEDNRAEAYYYYSLGRMHEMQMQTDQAIENYKQASKLDSKSAYPHVALANIYKNKQDTELAVQSAEKAVELDSEVVSGQRMLGNLYFSMLRSGGKAELAPLAIRAFSKAVDLEPGDIESRSTLARLLLASRNPDEAAKHLNAIIKSAPDSYYEMFLLGRVRSQQGDNNAAITLLKESLTLEPRQREARTLLVRLLEREHRFEEMVQIYQDALKSTPNDLDIRARLANSFLKGDQPQEAARHFKTILEDDPSNVAVLIGLAMARRDLLQLVGAEKLLDKAVTLSPENILAIYTLASVYEQKREYGKALTEWKKLLELPDQTEHLSNRHAEYWAHIGFAQEQLGNLDEMIAAFWEARKLATGNPRFEIFYIQGLLAAKKAAEAGEAIDAALSDYPDNVRFQALKAKAIEVNGDPVGALELALDLAKQSPEEELLAHSVIDLYHRQKRFREAELFLRQLLKTTPNKVSLQFQLAASLERQRKIDEAEKIFEQILDKDPHNAATLNYFGYMLADHGRRLEDSLNLIKRALSQDPYNGAYLDSLGWAYFKLGKLELAEENLLKAIDSMRLTGVVYDHLGDLYYQKGKRQQAIQFWRKALDQDDDEVEEDEIVHKIQRATSSQ